MPKLIDLTGMKFGRLTVLGVSHRVEKTKKIYWNAICDCGTPVATCGGRMKSGMTQSCGCLCRERLLNANLRHGRSHTPIHGIWSGMIQRCSPKAAKHCIADYYGRGIRVCERWHTFEKFLEDMGERPSLNHTLDRIDNDGDYEPSNCRWVTQREQCRNTRRNVMITHKGETLCLTDWSAKLDLCYETMRHRIKRGCSVEEILYTGNLQHANPFSK